MSPGPSQLPTGKPRPREAGEGRGQGTQRSGAALGGRSQSKDLKLGLRFDLRWGSGFRKALRAAVTGQFQASKRGILGTQSCVILCLPGAELRGLLSSPSGQSGARGKPPSQGLLGSCIGSAGSPRKGAPKTHGSLSHPRRPGVRATGWAFPPAPPPVPGFSVSAQPRPHNSSPQTAVSLSGLPVPNHTLLWVHTAAC